MANNLPWLAHHLNREGMVDFQRSPRLSFARLTATLATLAVSATAIFLQYDVMQSETATPDIPPKIMPVANSISCKGARAMIGVFAGYGIQNNELTAEKIAESANKEFMCTRWIDNGNNINIPAVGDAWVKDAEENNVTQLVGFGESVGSDEAAATENYIVDNYKEKFKFPALASDAGPDGKDTLKWVNRTVAEKVAEYCQYLKVGDITMTAVTLATDPNDYRRTHPLQYWTPVYNATKSASMRLRTAQSCLAAQGFDALRKEANTNIFYLRAGIKSKDPIVDVELAEKKIADKTSPQLFHPVYMYGEGISHAAPWDNWGAYGPYYREVIKSISEIIEARDEQRWYHRSFVQRPR